MNTFGWRPSEFSNSSNAGRRTWTVETTPCVDLLIDGLGLKDLVCRTSGAPLEGMVSVLDIETVEGDPVDVLTGAVPYEAWLSPGSRVPVLVCWCGDLMCGSLTASVEAENGQLSFREWGWENYYEEATPVALADMVFDATSLRSVAAEAVQWRRVHQDHPLTVVSVTGPDSVLHGPMPWHRKGPRATEKRMRRALSATRLEVNRTGDGDFDAYVAEVVGVSGFQVGDAGPDDIARLSRLVEAPYADRLPGATIAAVEWFRDRAAE